MIDAIFRNTVDWASVGGFVVGLIVALLIQHFWVKSLLHKLSTTDPPEGRYCLLWSALRARHNAIGGKRVGQFEVALFFTALVAAPEGAPLAIGAYLAFKVASKWEVWS